MQAQPEVLTAPGVNHYIEQFESLKDTLPGQDVAWLVDQRKSDLSRFSKIGFPTQRDEDWRYTPLRPVTSKNFSMATQVEAVTDLDRFRIPALDSYQMVFVDGQLDAGLSMTSLEQAGITIESMSSVLASRPETIENYLGQVRENNGHGFTSMNNAFYRDGVVITLADNAQLDKPIELIFLSRTELSLCLPRNLVLAGENSSAQIIERFVSADSSHTLTNSATEIVLERGAELDYYIVETQSKTAYQVCGVWAKQAEGSRFSCRTITLGGALVRNELRTDLNGVGAHCDMLGVYSLVGKQHVDNHTTMVHRAENCTSTELYKGVLDQRSRGVFHGRIKVAQGAQKTDARQTNNTLLLSRDAEIDTKPQLEIYADDVKCAHGATIGQIDENSLFYLRSRGIEESEARSLLTYAFVCDVLNKIDIVPLREYLVEILSSQLIPETDFRASNKVE
jgi:Fe-S cluster assembly protein SufD